MASRVRVASVPPNGMRDGACACAAGTSKFSRSIPLPFPCKKLLRQGGGFLRGGDGCRFECQ